MGTRTTHSKTQHAQGEGKGKEGTRCKPQRNLPLSFTEQAFLALDKAPGILRAEIEQPLPVFVFLFFREAVFGLGELEFAGAVEGDEAYAEVGSACQRVAQRGN